MQKAQVDLVLCLSFRTAHLFSWLCLFVGEHQSAAATLPGHSGDSLTSCDMLLNDCLGGRVFIYRVVFSSELSSDVLWITSDSAAAAAALQW